MVNNSNYALFDIDFSVRNTPLEPSEVFRGHCRAHFEVVCTEKYPFFHLKLPPNASGITCHAKARIWVLVLESPCG